MNTSIFTYQDNNITFKDADGNIMVNATEMAKPFESSNSTKSDPRPVKWMQNEQTTLFIEELQKVRNCTFDELVVIKQGRGGGTWFHEDVALEFARWLSPGFSIWCNDKIKELLTVGMTATDDTLENITNNPDLLIKLANKVKDLRAENDRTTMQLQLANSTITTQAPKVKYCEEVLSSDSNYKSTQVAKELGFTSAKAFHRKLKERSMAYKVSGQWVLTSKHSDKGYTATQTYPYYDTLGNLKTKASTVWTEKGRLWLHEKFNIKLSKTG